MHQQPHLFLELQSNRRHFQSLPEVLRRRVDEVVLAAVHRKRVPEGFVQIGAGVVIEIDLRLPPSIQHFLLRGFWHLPWTE